LNARGAIAEVGAKKDTDAAIHTGLTDVNVGLLYCTFKTGIGQLPLNRRIIITDPSAKLAITHGGHSRDLFISRHNFRDHFEAL